MEHRLAPGSFYGETLRSCQVAGFILSESAYPPNLAIPTHAHESAFFYFVLQGRSTEVSGQRTRTAEPATLVFHPAGEPHSNHWLNAGGQCFHLEITTTACERLGEHWLTLDAPADFRSGLPAWLAIRLHNEFHRPDGAAPLAMEGLALELLAEVSRRRVNVSERRPPRWLKQARELLHAQFAEPLSLGEIAQAVGVHPAHLARVFRQQFRCTVGDYVRRLRIEYACRELSTSDAPLLEIALSAGFADQSHFSRTFKRHLGLTPAEYQRHFRLCKAQTTE